MPKADAADGVVDHSPQSPYISPRIMAMGHTLVLVVIFFPLFVLCLGFIASADVAFFVGRDALAALIVVPFLVFVPLIHLWFRPKRMDFYIGTVWIPALIFAIVGGKVHEQSSIASQALANRDCFAFSEKREMYKAYEAAAKIRDECTLAQDFECAAFEELANGKYKPELQYLEALEYRFDCTGICRPGRRLWVNAGTEAPSCALFVSEWLAGAASMSWVVLCYSVIMAIFTIPGVLAVFSFMVVGEKLAA